MNRKTRLLTVILAVFVLCLTACSGDTASTGTTKSTEKPELEQVRSLCELATLKCYYHNVAKSVKTAGEGFSNLLKKDRTFWIEYDGTVKLGIDMSKVQMDIDGTDVTITIPAAKILDVSINQDSYNKDSYIMSADGLRENKITAQDATNAVNNAKEKMVQTAQQNTQLLMNAQDRAKTLIGNYITRIGELTGTEYTLHWNYIDNDGNVTGSEAADNAEGKTAA